MPDSIGWGSPGVHNQIAAQIYASSVSRTGHDPLGRSGLRRTRRGFGLAGVCCLVVAVWLCAPSELAGTATYVLAAGLAVAGAGLVTFSVLQRRRWRHAVAEFVRRSEHAVPGLRVQLHRSTDVKQVLDVWKADPELASIVDGCGMLLAPGTTPTTLLVSWVSPPAPGVLETLIGSVRSVPGVDDVHVL